MFLSLTACSILSDILVLWELFNRCWVNVLFAALFGCAYSFTYVILHLREWGGGIFLPFLLLSKTEGWRPGLWHFYGNCTGRWHCLTGISCVCKRAHMQLVRKHSATVISTHWAIVDWSWPKKVELVCVSYLHLKPSPQIFACEKTATTNIKERFQKKKVVWKEGWSHQGGPSSWVPL